MNVAYGISKGRCMYKRLHKYEPSKPMKKWCCHKEPPPGIKEFQMPKKTLWFVSLDALLDYDRYNIYTNAIQ